MTLTYTQQAIIRVAREWIGTPYHHQAALKGVGCDCLGLVRGVYRELYGREPEAPPAYSSSWIEETGSDELLKACHRHLSDVPLIDATVGDVLLFRMVRTGPVKHMAILVEDNRIVHAYVGHEVLETSMAISVASRLAAAFRFPALRVV